MWSGKECVTLPNSVNTCFIAVLSDGRFVNFIDLGTLYMGVFHIWNPNDLTKSQSTVVIDIPTMPYKVFMLLNDDFVTVCNHEYREYIDVWTVEGKHLIGYTKKKGIVICFAYLKAEEDMYKYTDTIKKLCLQTYDSMATLNGHTGSITDIAIIGPGKIVSSSKDKTLRIWAGNKCIKILKGHTKSVKKVLVHKDKIISMSKDLTLRVWDLDGDFLFEMKGFIDKIVDMKVVSDKLITVSLDERIRIWNLHTYEEESIWTSKIKNDTSITVWTKGRIITNHRNKIIILYF